MDALLNKNDKAPKAPEPNARQRLLETATELFAEKGYAGTSVREIVDRAGVSKPVLYYYFKSKEGLYYAILEWAAEVQQEILNEIFFAFSVTNDILSISYYILFYFCYFCFYIYFPYIIIICRIISIGKEEKIFCFSF